MIRKATMEDIKDIMEIIRKTIIEMRTYNNTQWDENYPQKKILLMILKMRIYL